MGQSISVIRDWGTLAGFEDQCLEIVEKYEDISYAMVVDLDGQILFHNNPAFQGKTIDDDEILNTIKSGRENSQILSIDKDYYDTQSNSSIFILKVLEDMSLSYTEVPVVPYGDNTTIKIFVENSTGPLENGIITSKDTDLSKVKTAKMSLFTEQLYQWEQISIRKTRLNMK